MITLSQIKAARALLDWKQDDLAKASGLSLPSINNLERGLYPPRAETLNSIKNALEGGGVEFIEGNGVRLWQEDYSLEHLIGPDFIERLDQDILSVMQSSDDEILGCMCNERKWIEYAGITNPIYIEARKKINWKERFLLPENADFYISDISSYRIIPSEYMGQITYEIYANRLALIQWEAMRITLIKNQTIATMFKKQFEVLWDMAKPLSEARAKKMERHINAVPQKGKKS